MTPMTHPFMSPVDPVRHASQLTRRHFFSRSSLTLGGAALAHLLGRDTAVAQDGPALGGLGQPHFAPKATRAIYLFMSGGPSQLDLFDYKPRLNADHGRDLPDSPVMGRPVIGSANCCPIPPGWRMNCASSNPFTPKPSTTIQPSRFL